MDEKRTAKGKFVKLMGKSSGNFRLTEINFGDFGFNLESSGNLNKIKENLVDRLNT